MTKNKEREAQYKFLMLLVVVIGLVLVASMYLKSGGNDGGSTNNGGDIPSNPTDENLDYTNMLVLKPTNICVGDDTRVTISTNIPNGVCAIFFNVGLGWQFLANVNLDANGDFSQNQQINQAGSATFRAVCCDDLGECRISNSVVLTVSNCATTTTTTQPTDIDYYCYDSDGGINYNVWGYCEDDYHQMGFADICEDGQLKEYYCDDDGICQHVYGASCGGGYTCSQIKYPTSQGSCNPGYCPDNGYCEYHPATLSMAAYCGCMTLL